MTRARRMIRRSSRLALSAALAFGAGWAVDLLPQRSTPRAQFDHRHRSRPMTLEQQIDNFRTRAKSFRDEHGSVESVVGTDHPFAKLGITSIDRVPIEVENITFMDTTDEGKPDVKLAAGMVYFHKDDHSMFGSKAVADDDDWGDL